MRKLLFLLFALNCFSALAQSDLNGKQFAGVRSKSLSEYLQNEETPIAPAIVAEKEAPVTSHAAVRMGLALGLVLCFGAVLYLVLRLARKQPVRDGNRKYLIEKMSYCSLGPKMGVSLIKVGSEFVLVGVTSENISFLSNLGKLQAQYEEESQFERENFKEAVEQEFLRIKGKAEIQV
ncbi:MAG: flagellar biosynthetic protein FliO [Bdellovibrionales bacterium]|nr:flagellar biosynthetic protein FliO [Bdellovibrionales bacterium]